MKLFFAITLSAFTTLAWADNPLHQDSPINDAVTSTPITPPPQKKGCLPPQYPPSAIQNNEEGTTTLALLIGADGSVKEGNVSKSSGYTDLDDAVLAALKLCHFKPGTEDGIPIDSWLKLQWVWKLADSHS